MSKASTRTHEAIADDALEFVEYGKNYSCWLAALMTAIGNELDGCAGKDKATARLSTAKDLASLGAILAQDCESYLEHHAGNLRRELEGGAQ